MKFITILFSLLLTSPVFGELTKEDVRAIMREEIAASEKRTREYIDLKIDVLDKSLSARIDTVNSRIDTVNSRIDAVDRSLGAKIDGVETRIDSVEKRLGDMRLLLIALVGLIAAAIAVPQIIIAHRERDWKQTRAEIQELREEIKALQNASS